jgi:hypothetical protein
MNTLLRTKIPILPALGLLLLISASCGSLMKVSGLAKGEDQDKSEKEDSRAEAKGPKGRDSSAEETRAGDTDDLSNREGRDVSLIRPKRKSPSPSGKALGGGEKAEVRRAAVKKAGALKSVGKMKICHVGDLDVWRVTLYVDKGSKIELKQFIWDAHEAKLRALSVSERIPEAELDSHIKKAEPGRDCEIIARPGSKSKESGWTRVNVEKTASTTVRSVPPRPPESTRGRHRSAAAASDSRPVLAKIITNRNEVANVKRFLAEWRSARERKDIATLRRLYHPNFSSGGLEYRGIIRAAKKRFRDQGKIRIKLGEPTLTKKNQRVLVNVSETRWEDGRRTDDHKTLVLARSRGKGYRILTEITALRDGNKK